MIGLSRNISYPVRLEEEIIKPGKVTWHGLTTGPMNSEINLICFVVAPPFPFMDRDDNSNRNSNSNSNSIALPPRRHKRRWNVSST
ncbi:hypothetical protein THAOC_14342 [Thalassiosira oceanica]|uniref:Uncharacterized protein n=1 Tax=Thalassiosira oceanica TaxID=159749 RepID=K0T354_THAOC|nr:hypothetical protein THAOC_14342 [Thalassiosira oceanica]|eukprot:EJK64872.1 hypothetical protein THAOC_14342 [Thalassiosira oceanica]